MFSCSTVYRPKVALCLPKRSRTRAGTVGATYRFLEILDPDSNPVLPTKYKLKWLVGTGPLVHTGRPALT
jgi:hypothetical protein